jgi:hypothetical protein
MPLVPLAITFVLMSPAHIHCGPGANVVHFLLHKAVSNAQGDGSKSRKDWESNDDTDVAGCRDLAKAEARRRAVRALSCLFGRLGEVGGQTGGQAILLAMVW